MSPDPGKVIMISDRRHGLPFSKGMLAQSFTATGLPPGRAYAVATAIQQDLRNADEIVVTLDRLRTLSASYLERLEGPEFAERYLRLRELSKLDKPLIVLIGGTTGVGKSTIAAEIAHRLGITRISSTDSIREVMRGIFTRDLMPAIHESAFNAWRGLRVPVPHGTDPVILGFREQTAAVAIGVKAIVDRAILEGENLVVEGVHLVPGYIDSSAFEHARIAQFIVGVADEDSHLSHFFIREVQTEGSRPLDRYRTSFADIRLLGGYIEDLAHEHGIPVVMSHQLDKTVAEALEIVVSAAIGGQGAAEDGGRPRRRHLEGGRGPK